MSEVPKKSEKVTSCTVRCGSSGGLLTYIPTDITTYRAAFAAKNTMLRPLECIKLKPHCKRRQVARNTGTYNQEMVAMKRGPAGQPPHSAYLLSMDNIKLLFLSVATIVSS